MPRLPIRRLPLLILLVAALAAALLLQGGLDFATLSRHRGALVAFRDAHPVAAPLAFIAAYATFVALSLPGALIFTLTGGFLFGLGPGTVYNVLAAGSGAVLLFLALRAGLGGDLARRLAHRRGPVAQALRGLRANEWSWLFVMRLVPVVPFFLANLLPAFTGTRLSRFALTTYLGILPGALVYTSVGAGLSDLFARGEAPDLGLIFTPSILGPLLGLAALAALPILFKRFRPVGDE
ncbi:TVP38/TMEM64 family protein [Xinfangfangia pollutisoli]|uniref:TVP38/TMEM64 family protein n=1 Tax=Xinfangfangia pollutisoli TaxID=2865960 RepID=UPI001CD22B37|nr:VTT domain-containing protein [Xinfangfangia pollutisoli]